MNKIQLINKSRKEYVCGRCHSIIPAGSSYYKGELNFSKPVIRCTKCKLESWEVTTSDYIKSVGEIVYHWQENYPITKEFDSHEGILSELEDIRDDIEERFNNIPESLHDAEIGEILQDRIDQLNEAINILETVDIEDIEADLAEDYNDPDTNDIDPISGDYTEDLDSAYVDAIDVALSMLEI